MNTGFNGVLSFTDPNTGKTIDFVRDVVYEVRKLRASVDLLVRLSNVAVGNVNISRLTALQLPWFERVFLDFGAGWNAGVVDLPGSETEHHDTRSKRRSLTD